MKTNVKILVVLLSYLLSQSLSANLKSETETEITYDHEQPVTNGWRRSLAEAFRDMAGLGYVTKHAALYNYQK